MLKEKKVKFNLNSVIPTSYPAGFYLFKLIFLKIFSLFCWRKFFWKNTVIVSLFLRDFLKYYFLDCYSIFSMQDGAVPNRNGFLGNHESDVPVSQVQILSIIFTKWNFSKRSR